MTMPTVSALSHSKKDPHEASILEEESKSIVHQADDLEAGPKDTQRDFSDDEVEQEEDGKSISLYYIIGGSAIGLFLLAILVWLITTSQKGQEPAKDQSGSKDLEKHTKTNVSLSPQPSHEPVPLSSELASPSPPKFSKQTEENLTDINDNTSEKLGKDAKPEINLEQVVKELKLKVVDGEAFERIKKDLMNSSLKGEIEELKETPNIIDKKTEDSLLLSFVRDNNEAAVENLLKRGADTEFRDTTGFTALHIAAFNFLPGITSLLLSRKANPNATINGSLYDTPIHQALKSWNSHASITDPAKLALVSSLIKAGAFLSINPSTSQSTCNYFKKCKINSMELSRMLYCDKDQQRELNDMIVDGVAKNNIEEVKGALHRGASLDKNYFGFNVDDDLLLCFCGADSDAAKKCTCSKDRGALESFSPMHAACFLGNEQIVKLFIEAKGDANLMFYGSAKNPIQSCLDGIAKELKNNADSKCESHIKILNLLLENDAKLSRSNKDFADKNFKSLKHNVCEILDEYDVKEDDEDGDEEEEEEEEE